MEIVLKIAIKNLAILQTGDLPAILRYRTIFSPHRILPLSPSMRGIKGGWLVSQKLSAASSDRHRDARISPKGCACFVNGFFTLPRIFLYFKQEYSTCRFPHT